MLIPQDSVLRNIPFSVEPRTVLFLDAIRYSLEISDLAYLRLAATLEESAQSHADDSSPGRPELIVAAFSDAWTIVDSVHRLRELVQQLPGLRKKEPAVQLLLRNTQVIEVLRNRIQHLRNAIDELVGDQLPLWGTISWSRFAPENGRPESHTIVPGTFFHDLTAIGCVFDTAGGRFRDRLALDVGHKRIDLARIHDRVVEFAGWFGDWCSKVYPADPEKHHQSDLHVRLQVELRRTNSTPARRE